MWNLKIRGREIDERKDRGRTEERHGERLSREKEKNICIHDEFKLVDRSLPRAHSSSKISSNFAIVDPTLWAI